MLEDGNVTIKEEPPYGRTLVFVNGIEITPSLVLKEVYLDFIKEA